MEDDVVSSYSCGSAPSVVDDCYDRPPSVPPPPLLDEVPIYSPFDEPPAYVSPTYVPPVDNCEPGPPVYILQSDYVRAKVGYSPRTGFTVTSEPPLPPNPCHIITHTDGRRAPYRFKVEDNFVMFDDVRRSDTGFYIISCKNSAGLEGKVMIQLDVYDAWPSSQAAISLNGPVINQQPMTSTSTAVNAPEVERGRKLNSYMNKWLFIYMFVIFVGIFLTWTLPCCLGVTVAYCVASVKADASDYEEAEKTMKVANYCLVFWVISCVVGILVLVIPLSIVL